MLGKAYLKLGKIEDGEIVARDYFENCIAIDPNFADAYLYSGIAIVELGNNYALVKKYFDKACELAPKNFETYF